MATGTIKLTADASTYEGRINWTSTTDKTAGKTTFTLTYQLHRVNTSGLGGNTSTYDLVTTPSLVEGKAVSPSRHVFPSDNITLTLDGTWVTLTSYTFYVYHSDTSGRASVKLDCKITGANGVTFTGAATLDFGRIIKAPSLLTAPNFTDEDSPTITYTNPHGNTITSIQAAIASENGGVTYIGYRDISLTGTSYTFNFTSSERSQLHALLADKFEVPVRFFIKAVIDGSPYYSYSAVKILSVVNGDPMMSPYIADTNAVTTMLTGNNTVLVKGVSVVDYDFRAVGKKGASIVKYELNCAEYTGYASTGRIIGPMSNELKFTIQDSRGTIVTKTFNMTMIDYVPLTCNQELSMDVNGTVSMRVFGNVFTDTFGDYDNEVYIYARFCKQGEDINSVDWEEITPLLTEFSRDYYQLDCIVDGLDPSGSYIFQSAAADYIMEKITPTYTITFMPVFDWSRNDFNFNVPVSIQGDVIDDFVIESGTEAMGTNGTWYWRKWRSGRAECYGCRSFGNMAVNTAWGSLYRSATFEQDIPYGLFVATPEVIDISYRGSDFGGWVIKHEQTAATTYTTGAFCLVRPTSATVSSVHFGFNIIGRWK